MQRGAIFSPCRAYRYVLWRIWDSARPWVLFIGLNPSTADEAQDDPTIRRCMGFAKRWGFGGIKVANLFAYRAVCPSKLKQVQDPVGPDNDRWISKLASSAGMVVAAWGNGGTFFSRGEQILSRLQGVHCLALTRAGQPAHPLYLKANLQPKPFISPRHQA